MFHLVRWFHFTARDCHLYRVSHGEIYNFRTQCYHLNIVSHGEMASFHNSRMPPKSPSHGKMVSFHKPRLSLTCNFLHAEVASVNNSRLTTLCLTLWDGFVLRAEIATFVLSYMVRPLHFTPGDCHPYCVSRGEMASFHNSSLPSTVFPKLHSELYPRWWWWSCWRKGGG